LSLVRDAQSYKKVPISAGFAEVLGAKGAPRISILIAYHP